jgi:hypothetical protein
MEKRTSMVALFDLDGVLIQPGGYRAAVTATVNYFSQKMGLGQQAPNEDDLALLEANGITSEWDMVPICLVVLIEKASQAANAVFPDCSFEDLILLVRTLAISIDVNYRSEIRQMLPFLMKPSISPSEGLLDAIQAGKIYPGFQKAAFIRDLMGNTRHISDSKTLRVFQNYILGDRGFIEAYSLIPEFETHSYLRLNDVCLLSDENQRMLNRLISDSVIKLAVITARPSLPPAGAHDLLNDYSPEAEMAIKLTGLDGIPVVGFGTLQFLARKIGVLPDSLIKPSPIQALTAIKAAFGETMIRSLEWAAANGITGGDHQGASHLPSKFTLHIFEDSPIGIHSCQQAAFILKQKGCEVTVKAWGIARNPDKIKALEAVKAEVFPDVNQAIQAAFSNSLDSFS